MSYVTYSSTGPFNPGGAPGISSTFLNNIEQFLALLWSDSQITSNHAGILTMVGAVIGSGLLTLTARQQIISGSTSGTYTLNEYCVGSSSLKFVLGFFNNYKNAGSALSITLNAPFTVQSAGLNIAGKDLQLWSGVSQLSNINELSALGSGNGSTSTQNILNKNSISGIPQGFDTIKEPGGNSTTSTGITLFIGV